MSPSKKIFIVHGRDMGAVQKLREFIEQAGYVPQTFDDVRGWLKGAPSVQAVVKHGLDGASAAIVFLTPDQLSFLDPRLRQSPQERHTWESRPNVMFEAGMAYQLAQERTIFVGLRGVTIPSDLSGIDIIYFDTLTGPSALRSRLEATIARRSLGDSPTVSKDLASVPVQAVNLRVVDPFLVDLLERLRSFHLGSPAVYSVCDVLQAVAPHRQDWYGTPARELIMAALEQFTSRETTEFYWALLINGVLEFQDIHDWWDDEVDEAPTWRQSVDYSQLSPLGVSLLNLMAAGYLGRVGKPTPRRDSRKTSTESRPAAKRRRR